MQRKSKMIASSSDSSVLPITNEQKIKIAALDGDIKNLIREINKPYSMAASAVAIPLLMQLLVLNQYAPLYALYDRYNDHVHDKLSNESLESMYGDTLPAIKSIFEHHKTILGYLSNLQLAYLESEGRQLSLVEMVEKIDEVNLPQFSHIKQNMIKHCTSFHALLTTPETMNGILDSLRTKLEKMNTKELFLFMEETFAKIFGEDLPKILGIVSKKFAGIKAPIEINKTMLLIKSAGLIALDFFVVNKLYDHILPHGGFSSVKKPTALNMNEWVSAKMADNHILHMEKYKHDLKKRAESHRNISRPLSLVFVLLATFIFSIATSEWLVYLCISLLSSALSNLIQDYKAKLDQHNFNARASKLEQQEKMYAELSHGLPIKISTIRGSNVEQSYLQIEFTKHRGLSVKTVAKLFKHCLLHHGASITFDNETSLHLSANIRASYRLLNKIKNMFLECVERRIEIKKRVAQVTSLVTTFMMPSFDEEAIVTIPSYDENGLPIVEIRFDVPNDRQNLLTEMGQHCDLEIETESPDSDEDYLSVTMRGFQAIKDRDTLQKKLIAMTAPKSADGEAETRPINYPVSGAPLKVRRKCNSSPAPKNTEEKPTPPDEQRVVVVFPGAGIYDSKNPNCKIYPAVVGNKLDNRSTLNTHYYVRNSLRHSTFPPSTEGLEQAVRSIIQSNPTIKPGKHKKGTGTKQGITFDWGNAVNQDGERIEYSAKLRLLGHANGRGDARFFARERKSDDNRKILLDFEAATFDAH